MVGGPDGDEDLKAEVRKLGARRLTEMYLESSRIVHIGMKGALSGGPARCRVRAAAARR